MWGDRGNLAGLPVSDIWSKVADDLHGTIEVADCGHYLPEEQPGLVVDYLLRFAKECFGASYP
jgi:haloacetate dehalogenase